MEGEVEVGRQVAVLAEVDDSRAGPVAVFAAAGALLVERLDVAVDVGKLMNAELPVVDGLFHRGLTVGAHARMATSRQGTGPGQVADVVSQIVNLMRRSCHISSPTDGSTSLEIQ